MSFAVIQTRAQIGIEAYPVSVEVHLARGMPQFAIVGLPEMAVRESKDRVRSALLNSGFELPKTRKKIIVNLAPADLPKSGSSFDLAIAIGMLAASHQLPMEDLAKYEFLGELALSGALRPIKGGISVALACKKAGHALILPTLNAEEVALVNSQTMYAAEHLLDVVAHLTHKKEIPAILPLPLDMNIAYQHDLAEVKGQHHAKRALEIAAAGNHSLLMVGPPGSGKTMLASRLPSILPPLSQEEALETTAIRSAHGGHFDFKKWRERPFRSPHHTASAVALVGGGNPPKPGEISLAHHGVLFLDELPEFSRQALETLREPLESGTISIARAARHAQYPAQFQLIAAMNPCPCGHLGNPHESCRCSPGQIAHYMNRLSAPFLDRIDLYIEVPAVKKEVLLSQAPPTMTSSIIREQVILALQRQYERQGKTNHVLTVTELERFCALGPQEAQYLDQAMNTFKLSARGYHRVLRVARTIADLAGHQTIELTHLKEALMYRGTRTQGPHRE